MLNAYLLSFILVFTALQLSAVSAGSHDDPPTPCPGLTGKDSSPHVFPVLDYKGGSGEDVHQALNLTSLLMRLEDAGLFARVTSVPTLLFPEYGNILRENIFVFFRRQPGLVLALGDVVKAYALNPQQEPSLTPFALYAWRKLQRLDNMVAETADPSGWRLSPDLATRLLHRFISMGYPLGTSDEDHRALAHALIEYLIDQLTRFHSPLSSQNRSHELLDALAAHFSDPINLQYESATLRFFQQVWLAYLHAHIPTTAVSFLTPKSPELLSANITDLMRIFHATPKKSRVTNYLMVSAVEAGAIYAHSVHMQILEPSTTQRRQTTQRDLQQRFNHGLTLAINILNIALELELTSSDLSSNLILLQSLKDKLAGLLYRLDSSGSADQRALNLEEERSRLPRILD